jgi:hypothetical protein
MDPKARCVAELHQIVKAYEGQLIEAKKHMRVLHSWDYTADMYD